MPTNLTPPPAPKNPPANSPPWQKAIFRRVGLVPRFLQGKDIFIFRPQPLWTFGAHPVSGEPTVAAWCWMTNLINHDGRSVRVPENLVNLVNDWAWTVYQIPWETWGPTCYHKPTAQVPK